MQTIEKALEAARKVSLETKRVCYVYPWRHTYRDGDKVKIAMFRNSTKYMGDVGLLPVACAIPPRNDAYGCYDYSS